MKYSTINIIYNLPFSNYLGGFIKKKLLKNNRITFIPTNKKKLPKKNHPILNSIQYQEEIIDLYIKKKKISFNSFSDLKHLLKKKFNSNTKFNFLDIGGDKLDFYLDISKEFKNVNYFLINLPEVNQIIKTIKNKYNFVNLRVLNNLDEIKSHNYDFVYFGSTLQYLDNYENFIKEIIPITKKYVFLSATWFFQNDNYLRNIVVKQLNFLPKEFYLYFFNLNFIQKIFKNQSFKTELIEVNNSYSCSFKNFEKLNIKNIKYTNILFTKES
jgi:ubiquinone/menaquinone biosynthesis C-methylase UbiE